MPERARHYFDYAASCPPWKEALEAAARCAHEFPGNPSAVHESGRRAREAWETLSQRFKALCKFSDGRLLGCSGGTEANNLAIRGILDRRPSGRLLLAADAHPSAWFAAQIYAKRTDILPLERDGTLSPQKLAKMIRKDTVLVSCMHASNETGFVQDIAALGAACAERKVLFHVDGVQAVGHLPLDLSGAPVDYYAFSAHKFGGPRGFGGLLLRDADLLPQVLGGDQQDGLRAGTENLPGLAGTVAALEVCLARLEADTCRLRGLADELVGSIRTASPSVILNSDSGRGLPGLVSLSFPGIDAQVLIADLDLQGFAVAAGGACHAQRHEPSRAILALGRSKREAQGTLRISMGHATQRAEVLALGEALAQAAARQAALA